MAVRAWLRAMIPAAMGRGAPGWVENVLVHYVGHGMFKPNSQEYYLSIDTTDAEDRAVTSASLGGLNGILLKNASKQRRVYLIDACFAAAAVRDLMGVLENAIEVSLGGLIGAWPEEQWGESGVAALCSADATASASAGGRGELTQFTDGLLSVLADGDVASGTCLSLRRTHHMLRLRLREHYGEDAVHPVLVAPEDRDGGIAGAPLFPNLMGRGRSARPAPVREDAVASPADARDDPDAPGVAEESGPPPGTGRPTPVSQTRPGPSIIPTWVGRALPGWDTDDGDEVTPEAMALSPEQRFRQATYRFFRLSHSKKEEIAAGLDPAHATGTALGDLHRYKAVLSQVRETGAIDRLESMIGNAEGQ